jgi:hypothetical protein
MMHWQIVQVLELGYMIISQFWYDVYRSSTGSCCSRWVVMYDATASWCMMWLARWLHVLFCQLENDW